MLFCWTPQEGDAQLRVLQGQWADCVQTRGQGKGAATLRTMHGCEALQHATDTLRCTGWRSAQVSTNLTCPTSMFAFACHLPRRAHQAQHSMLAPAIL